jgi:hypothetical protein
MRPLVQPAALALQYRREGDMHGKGGVTLVLGKPRWHRRGRALVALGLLAGLLLGWGHSAPAQPKPAGEMRWALYVTFPPAWLDPGEVAVGGQTLFAQFLTLCSASNLAEAWCISSPWQGSSPAKT